MRLEDYDTGDRYTAEVTANRRITPEHAKEVVYELTLQVDSPFHYEAGQSIGVIVQGPFEQEQDEHHHPLKHPHHFRLYTVSDAPSATQSTIRICVKQCDYIDDFSGESYPGIASNYLCSRKPGDQITVNGPFGRPWILPPDRTADLLMIGLGTGIAPFRALLRTLQQQQTGWDGRIWLLNLARSGDELLYMNEQLDDLSSLAEESFVEISGVLSPRPHWDEPVALDDLLTANADQLVSLLRSQHGTVYVAGREEILATLDQIITRLLGAETDWPALRETLAETDRWQELVY